jgi:hypothetical protein
MSDSQKKNDDGEAMAGLGCLGALLGGMAFFGVGGILAVVLASPLAAIVIGPCAGLLGIVAGAVGGAMLGSVVGRKGP